MNETDQSPLPPIIPLTPYPIDTVTGNLSNQLVNMQKHMPASNSNNYAIPAEEDRVTFAGIALLINDGDLITAGKLADANGYRLIRYIDKRDESAPSFLLEELTPVKNGWGMYVFRESGKNSVILEAPHPVSDQRSERVALNLYRVLQARALLVAGAHRTATDASADVANVPESVFQSIHLALLNRTPEKDEKTLILQVHGFSTFKHPEYPQVILGYETGSSQLLETIILELQKALEARGISAGVCDGKSWRELCGTKNIQAATSKGKMFIHMEISEGLRLYDTDLISAIEEVLTKNGIIGDK